MFLDFEGQNPSHFPGGILRFGFWILDSGFWRLSPQAGPRAWLLGIGFLGFGFWIHPSAGGNPTWILRFGFWIPDSGFWRQNLSWSQNGFSGFVFWDLDSGF